MEAINSTIVFEETHVNEKEELETSVDVKSMENLMDHYDEPSYFFRGAIFGLIFCVPFWVAIFWLIA